MNGRHYCNAAEAIAEIVYPLLLWREKGPIAEANEVESTFKVCWHIPLGNELRYSFENSVPEKRTMCSKLAVCDCGHQRCVNIWHTISLYSVIILPSTTRKKMRQCSLKRRRKEPTFCTLCLWRRNYGNNVYFSCCFFYRHHHSARICSTCCVSQYHSTFRVTRTWWRKIPPSIHFQWPFYHYFSFCFFVRLSYFWANVVAPSEPFMIRLLFFDSSLGSPYTMRSLWCHILAFLRTVSLGRGKTGAQRNKFDICAVLHRKQIFLRRKAHLQPCKIWFTAWQ